MHKVATNLICLFVPSKVMRRHLRVCLSEYSPSQDRLNLAEFLETPVPDQCVLLVEPSITHGELAPGFTKYWLDLGYHVHVLLHNKVVRDDPFCRFSHERLHIFCHSYCNYENFLASEKIADYSFVFFTTAAMERALSLLTDAYSAMQQQLKLLSTEIYEKSLMNLERSVKNSLHFSETK